jgi:hypothetical protein
MKKIPWIISAVFLVLLLLIFKSKSEEITALNAQNYSLSQQVKVANERYDNLVAQSNKVVEDANMKIYAASLSEVTADLSFRSAMMGSGLVAKITNSSGVSTPFTIEAKRPSTGQSKSFDVVLDSGGMSEIGHSEGWPFIDGDIVTVSQPGHKSRVYSVKQ